MSFAMRQFFRKRAKKGKYKRQNYDHYNIEAFDLLVRRMKGKCRVGIWGFYIR